MPRNTYVAVFFHLFRRIVRFMGSIFLMMAILATTRVPFDVHRWLGTSGSDFTFEPDHIIMLGGSGMPSESNLIRLYYTRELAELFPNADIILCHPDDSSVVQLMVDYLQQPGFPDSQIHHGSHGNSTREQGMELMNHYKGISHEKILVVTSPENMYRTVRSFRKLGFENVGGVSAVENAMFSDLSYNFEKVGGKVFVPDVSGSLGLRYNFWNYLKLEITCMREIAAIGYYKLNGWM